MVLKKGAKPWNNGLTKETDKRIMNQSLKQIGHIVSEESRLKSSKSMKGKYIGKNHPNWLGGKSFEPVYVREIVKKIAEIKNLSEEEVAEAIVANAKRLFGI